MEKAIAPKVVSSKDWNQIKLWTGFENDDIKAIARASNLPDIFSELNDAQAEELRDRVFLAWSIKTGFKLPQSFYTRAA
jgi:23S rRNA A1618 N6-methylase RlmF